MDVHGGFVIGKVVKQRDSQFQVAEIPKNDTSWIESWHPCFLGGGFWTLGREFARNIQILTLHPAGNYQLVSWEMQIHESYVFCLLSRSHVVSLKDVVWGYPPPTKQWNNHLFIFMKGPPELNLHFHKLNHCFRGPGIPPRGRVVFVVFFSFWRKLAHITLAYVPTDSYPVSLIQSAELAKLYIFCLWTCGCSFWRDMLAL